jgi:hypothetical protein
VRRGGGYPCCDAVARGGSGETNAQRTTAGRRDSGPAQSPDAPPDSCRCAARHASRYVQVVFTHHRGDGWRLRQRLPALKLLSLALYTDCTPREQKPASSVMCEQLATRPRSRTTAPNAIVGQTPESWRLSPTRWLIFCRFSTMRRLPCRRRCTLSLDRTSTRALHLVMSWMVCFGTECRPFGGWPRGVSDSSPSVPVCFTCFYSPGRGTDLRSTSAVELLRRRIASLHSSTRSR